MPTVMYKRNRYFLERKKYVIFSFKNCLNQKKKEKKRVHYWTHIRITTYTLWKRQILQNHTENYHLDPTFWYRTLTYLEYS